MTLFFSRSGHSLFVSCTNRGKSGHQRAGFPAKAGGICIKTNPRLVQQKTNRLNYKVRVKRWSKSPPSQGSLCELGKPNPMQDEIGNRAARSMVSGTSHPHLRNPLVDR